MDKEKEEKRETISLLIGWHENVCTLFAKQVNARLANKDQTLPVPPWITNAINKDGILEEDPLRYSILDYLKKAGGTQESFGCVLISGTDLRQFIHVISAVCVIENNAFMQAVMRAVREETAADAASKAGGRTGLYLASLAFISAGKTESVCAQPIGALPVAERNINLFNDGNYLLTTFYYLNNFFL